MIIRVGDLVKAKFVTGEILGRVVQITPEFYLVRIKFQHSNFEHIYSLKHVEPVIDINRGEIIEEILNNGTQIPEDRDI